MGIASLEVFGLPLLSDSPSERQPPGIFIPQTTMRSHRIARLFAGGFGPFARGVIAVCLAAVPAASQAADDTDFRPPLTLDQNPSPFFTAIGSATSQGVSVLNADQARSTFGVTGAGVKLGVISDSFNGSGSSPTLATQIAAGNLPGAGNPGGYTTGVTVVKDAAGSDEGRAMLEIVHDVAPGARLYFHSAFNNTQTPGWTSHETAAPDQTIADAIDGLAAVAGMRIIVDDVGILTAPRFQDGAAARAVNSAFASGIATFSSAGNSATNATRVTTSAGVNQTVNWGSDDVLVMSLAGRQSGRIVLQWGERYPSVSGATTTSNFVAHVTSPNGATTYWSIDDQWANEDPYEFVQITNNGTASASFAIRATRTTGTAPFVMQVSTFGSGLQIVDSDMNQAPTVYGHAAAAGAVAVAASYWATPSSVEAFSSRGPALILFDAAGNPINETRPTPLLTAPDGGTTTTAGFNPFFGTSAAAPHAAAVAALVLERFDQKGVAVSTRDLYQVLYDSAVDIGPAGFDTASGYGRIDALAAVSAGRIWDGNGAAAGVAGSGSWSQAKWTLEATGDKPTGRFIRGQQAVFGSGTAAPASYSIVVDGNYDVAGLSFARDTVTLASGSGALRLTAPTIDVATGLTATVAATLSGTSGLVKTGDGILQLTGSTAFTGGSVVNAGLMSVNGVLSGTVAVAPGGVLGGAGTIIGNVTVAGTHAPGNSPDVSTIAGDLSYAAGSTVLWEIAANSTTQGPPGSRSFDQIVVGGNLTFSGSTALALSFFDQDPASTWISSVDWNDDFWSASRLWRIFDVAGTTTGALTNLFLRTESWLDSRGIGLAAARPNHGFSLALSDNDVMLVYVVPEPTTLALAAAGTVALWLMRRPARRTGGAGRRSGAARAEKAPAAARANRESPRRRAAATRRPTPRGDRRRTSGAVDRRRARPS